MVQILADLVTFTAEILNGKIHFLCSDTYIVKGRRICFWSSNEFGEKS